MENWKRAVVAGSVGTSAILFVKGKRPAGVLKGGAASLARRQENGSGDEQTGWQRGSLGRYLRESLTSLTHPPLPTASAAHHFGRQRIVAARAAASSVGTDLAEARVRDAMMVRDFVEQDPSNLAPQHAYIRPVLGKEHPPVQFDLVGRRQVVSGRIRVPGRQRNAPIESQGLADARRIFVLQGDLDVIESHRLWHTVKDFSRKPLKLFFGHSAASHPCLR